MGSCTPRVPKCSWHLLPTLPLVLLEALLLSRWRQSRAPCPGRMEHSMDSEPQNTGLRARRTTTKHGTYWLIEWLVRRLISKEEEQGLMADTSIASKAFLHPGLPTHSELPHTMSSGWESGLSPLRSITQSQDHQM